MKLEDTVRFFVYVPDVRPWTHESPNMYTLLLRLQHEGRYTEYIAYKLGMRSIEMKNGEFIVNGSPVQLHMAEYTYKGDPAAAERELRGMKAGGINAVKIEGSPQPDAFYDICDRVGLYVCNQADIDTRAGGASRAKGGNPSNDPQWEPAYVDRTLAMYYTSKNHPSVAMFSLAENSANGYNLYESYIALKSLGDSRPVVYLDGGGEWNTDALYAALHRDHAEGLARRIKLESTPASDSGQTMPTFAVATGAGSSLANDGDGVFNITNNYITAELRNPVVAWKVKQGKRVVSQGEKTVMESIPAGSSAQIAFSYGKAKPGKPLTVELTAYRPREAFDPAPAPTRKRNKNDRPNLIKLTTQTLTVQF